MHEQLSLNWVEWFGYSASLVILISLTMSSIIKLRILNLIGCILFTVFAYFIQSWPTLVMNLGIVFINLYFLYGIYSTKEEFKLVSTSLDSEHLKHFITNNEFEIAKQASVIQLYQANRAFYMLRDNHVAGLLVGTLTEDGCFTIYVDYVLPKFQDHKLGLYYFKTDTHFLKERGIKTIKAYATTQAHKSYLTKVGFMPFESNSTHFKIQL